MFRINSQEARPRVEGKQCYRTRGLATRPPADLSAGVLLFLLLVQSLFKTPSPVGRAREETELSHAHL